MEGESDAASDLRAPASMEGERPTPPQICAPQPPWKGIQTLANLSPYPPSRRSSSSVLITRRVQQPPSRERVATGEADRRRSNKQVRVASAVIRDTTFGSMGAVEPPAWMSAAARRWLENAGATAEDAPGRGFNALPLSGVRVSLAERGRALCSLRVPPHLTDAEGNWHADAIVAAADDVCAAAIMSVEGIIKVSIHYGISYFTPAKLHVDEVEMDGRVVDQKGRMTTVAVEIWKKESGELVAIGRQWMTASRPKVAAAHSKI
ncbi:hypothetical protein Zm00014a_039475 [Zea mays]|uniref:Thioesterase domain-containing protein n=1 Tax=Zea mays TaxID=4577 RepID=A0A317Y5H9_MAIZE|nr:hypothetical protein Zm00014a_039475 [Zea mays]